MSTPAQLGERVIVAASTLRGLGQAILGRLGLPERDAEVSVDCLVEADLRGVHSHGMVRLPSYVERLVQGGGNPRPNIRITTQTDSSAVIDGDNGLGQVVSGRGMELAIEKAHRTGVGIVGARNSHHFGGCFYWAEMALPHGMIGVASTNCGPIMAPWGGRTGSLCNNPVGVAIPAGQELPIVLDMAMSVAAGGKLDLAILQGEKIPLGWATDPAGIPTQDPRLARAGLLLPAGGYKGYAAMVVLEVLAAVLMGARFGRQVEAQNPAIPRGIGHFFQAISVAAFMPLLEFEHRVDELIRQLKSSELAPGSERIWLPGEMEFEKRAEYQVTGIPMLASVVRKLETMAVPGGI
jgi:LDH2 family malate/lactate/ureidoglycolate dehydrogenase